MAKPAIKAAAIPETFPSNLTAAPVNGVNVTLEVGLVVVVPLVPTVPTAPAVVEAAALVGAAEPVTRTTEADVAADV